MFRKTEFNITTINRKPTKENSRRKRKTSIKKGTEKDSE